MSASDYLDPTLSNIHIIIDIIFFVFLKSVVEKTFVSTDKKIKGSVALQLHYTVIVHYIKCI